MNPVKHKNRILQKHEEEIKHPPNKKIKVNDIRLPGVIWIKIFQALPFKDRLSCSQTSKLFHQYIHQNSVWAQDFYDYQSRIDNELLSQKDCLLTLFRAQHLLEKTWLKPSLDWIYTSRIIKSQSFQGLSYAPAFIDPHYFNFTAYNQKDYRDVMVSKSFQSVLTGEKTELKKNEKIKEEWNGCVYLPYSGEEIYLVDKMAPPLLKGLSTLIFYNAHLNYLEIYTSKQMKILKLNEKILLRNPFFSWKEAFQIRKKDELNIIIDHWTISK